MIQGETIFIIGKSRHWQAPGRWPTDVLDAGSFMSKERFTIESGLAKEEMSVDFNEPNLNSITKSRQQGFDRFDEPFRQEFREIMKRRKRRLFR
jgi:hypothetical protein